MIDGIDTSDPRYRYAYERANNWLRRAHALRFTANRMRADGNTADDWELLLAAAHEWERQQT